MYVFMYLFIHLFKGTGASEFVERTQRRMCTEIQICSSNASAVCLSVCLSVCLYSTLAWLHHSAGDERIFLGASLYVIGFEGQPVSKNET
jgi:hypothetical protein